MIFVGRGDEDALGAGVAESKVGAEPVGAIIDGKGAEVMGARGRTRLIPAAGGAGATAESKRKKTRRVRHDREVRGKAYMVANLVRKWKAM